MATRRMKIYPYRKQEKEFHSLEGRHILAYWDQSFVTVYQAFSSEIADFAMKNGHFGGQHFDSERGTWLKTSFMMMMSISKWATIPGRERIFAIRIRKKRFQEILEKATTGTRYTEHQCEVRSKEVTLLWNQDVSIDDTPIMRNALLVYIQPNFLATFNDEFIYDFFDVTPFVKDQLQLIQLGNYEKLKVPRETIFIPEDTHLATFIMLDSCCERKSVEDGTGNKKEITNDQNVSRTAVLVLQGSFNPVHKQHIEILRVSKDWVETNTPYTVVATVMLVNTDTFLRTKFKNTKETVIQIHHRLEMCGLAAEPYEWIHVLEMTEGVHSSQLLNLFVQRLALPRCKIFTLFGADRALQVRHTAIHNSIFVGREGQTQRMMERFEKVKNDGKMDPSALKIISAEMPNISSTVIRKYIERIVHKKSASKQRKIAEELVWLDWIDSCVGDYLVKFSSELFMQ